jgi:two-component system chemotaxis response regulator CheB
VVATNQEPRQNGCRPAVDVLFRSAAAVFGDRVLACVLTGMGQDGLRGSERLRAAGAEIVVQDDATSVVWGMPGAVATAGLADRILPLPQIAADLTDALRRMRDRTPPSSRIDAGAAP